MAENLAVGTKIAGTETPTDNGIIEIYCYDDEDENCEVYGGLYPWDEMMQYVTDSKTKGICPAGWHIPDSSELAYLVNGLGGETTAGGALKETGTTHWIDPNEGASNSSGFTALPGGEKTATTGAFNELTEAGTFWTSTLDEGTLLASKMSVYYDAINATISNIDKDNSFSVRCVKDFECGDSLIDMRDNKIYGTTKIGEQCWMSENMNVGTLLNSATNQSDNGSIEKYCYDDLESNCDLYGGLYQWNEAMQYSTDDGSVGICPDGWYLATEFDWIILEGTIDSFYDSSDPGWDGGPILAGYDCGKNIKSTSGWLGDGNGLDLYGFSALPGGVWGGSFYWIDYYSHFWTSTYEVSGAWGHSLEYDEDGINHFEAINLDAGYSIRCIKK